MSVKLKLSKEIIEKLRESIWFENIKDRAIALLICDMLVNYDGNTLNYPAKNNMLTVFKKYICKDSTKIKLIIERLFKMHLICLDKTEINLWKKPLWNLQIREEYQNGEWYNFSENDSEYNLLAKIKNRNRKKHQSKWNDGFILLPETDFENVSSDALEIFERRHFGEVVKSRIKKTAKSGRLFGIYTNMPGDLRKKLIDGYTGNQLAEIDLKASQVSFVLSFMRNKSENHINETEIKKELAELNAIQKESSFHDYFLNLILNNGLKLDLEIDRDSIKPLIFKFLFGNFAKHDDLPYFAKEIKELFDYKHYDLLKVWHLFISIVKVQFPYFYNFMAETTYKIKKKNDTLSRKMQKNESIWLEEILKALRQISKNDESFQYYTVHDAVYFSSEFLENVVEIFDRVNKNWKEKYDINLFYKIKNGNPPFSQIAASPVKDSVWTDKERKSDTKLKKENKEAIPSPHAIKIVPFESLSVQTKVKNRKKHTKIRILEDNRFRLSVQNKNYSSRRKETLKEFSERISNVLPKDQYDLILWEVII